MMLRVSDAANKFKAFVSSIVAPELAERVQATAQTTARRESDLFADLSSFPLLDQFFSSDMVLDRYENQYGIDVLANMLMKAIEFDNVAISKRANVLFDRMLERWSQGEETVDQVVSLKLFDNFPHLVPGDHRKIKVLRAYHELMYLKTKRLRSLKDVLVKNYRSAKAKQLLKFMRAEDTAQLRASYTGEWQRKMMADWSKRKLSADDVFKELRLREKGNLIFFSSELQTLDRYVKTYLGNDMLSVLIKGFGEARFAELAYEAYALKHNHIAKTYLYELLKTWKKQKIEPEKLLETKFTDLYSTSIQKDIQKVIKGHYRELYLKD